MKGADDMDDDDLAIFIVTNFTTTHDAPILQPSLSVLGEIKAQHVPLRHVLPDGDYHGSPMDSIHKFSAVMRPSV